MRKTILEVQIVDDSEGTDADATTEYEGTTFDVILRNSYFRCTKCRRLKGGSHFGLRRMKGNVVRNQAQCRPCRSRRSK